jgi:hypothetical protein
MSSFATLESRWKSCARISFEYLRSVSLLFDPKRLTLCATIETCVLPYHVVVFDLNEGLSHSAPRRPIDTQNSPAEPTV